MKTSHKAILFLIEDYLSQPGAEHLRFWQALYNLGVIKSQMTDTGIHLEQQIIDDYNISDKELLKRIKENEYI